MVLRLVIRLLMLLLLLLLLLQMMMVMVMMMMIVTTEFTLHTLPVPPGFLRFVTLLALLR